MTPTVVYETCGLRIRSAVELHLPRSDGSAADVDIVLGPELDDDGSTPPGEVVAVDEAFDVGWYTVTDTGVDHRLRFRDCAEFVVGPGARTVTVRPMPDGRTELIPILLAGTVLALVLTLRGSTVLHAAAVAHAGRATALVGHAGRGKSTIAALLCAAGAELVTDDVLVVEAARPPVCLGGASELRLRDSASTALDLDDGAVRRTADDRTAWRVARRAFGVQDIGAIVVPVPAREHTTLETRQLPPHEALLALLACPRINGWRRPTEVARDFGVLAEIANAVPVHAAIVPWGPPFDAAIGEALLDRVG